MAAEHPQARSASTFQIAIFDRETKRYWLSPTGIHTTLLDKIKCELGLLAD